MAKDKFPREIIVYVDYRLDDGQPVYGVVTKLAGMDPNDAPCKVGIYVLNRPESFTIKRSLS